MNPTIFLVTEVEVVTEVAAVDCSCRNNERDRFDGLVVVVETKGSIELDIM